MTEAPSQLGPLEEVWEDFRASVFDEEPDPEDDEKFNAVLFLCGARAALLAIENGATVGEVHADLVRMKQRLQEDGKP